jgi:opine dehydrogenase
MVSQSIGIVGSSHSAHALAAYLSSQGHEITIMARNPAKLGSLKESLMIRSEGKVEGIFPIKKITDDWETFCKDVSVIFLATVTTAYRDIMPQMAPYLKKGHIVVAFSSKLCGSLELDHGFKKLGVRGVKTLETDALFACRLKEPGVIWIRGFKGWNLYSSPQKWETLEYGALLSRFFPGLEPAENIIQRGLTDFGAHAHAVITLANISRIDRGEEFLFYHEGLSNQTVVLLEKIAQEFKAVAKSYGTDLIALPDLLNRYYGCTPTDLLTAMRTVPNYRHSLAPRELNHRYLVEDVACTLVPLSELAQKSGIKTPMVDAVITLASVLSGRQLRESGRTLQDLGWASWGQKEVIKWINQ